MGEAVSYDAFRADMEFWAQPGGRQTCRTRSGSGTKTPPETERPNPVRQHGYARRLVSGSSARGRHLEQGRPACADWDESCLLGDVARLFRFAVSASF